MGRALAQPASHLKKKRQLSRSKNQHQIQLQGSVKAELPGCVL